MNTDKTIPKYSIYQQEVTKKYPILLVKLWLSKTSYIFQRMNDHLQPALLCNQKFRCTLSDVLVQCFSNTNMGTEIVQCDLIIM